MLQSYHHGTRIAALVSMIRRSKTGTHPFSHSTRQNSTSYSSVFMAEIEGRLKMKMGTRGPNSKLLLWIWNSSPYFRPIILIVTDVHNDLGRNTFRAVYSLSLLTFDDNKKGFTAMGGIELGPQGFRDLRCKKKSQLRWKFPGFHDVMSPAKSRVKIAFPKTRMRSFGRFIHFIQPKLCS